MNSDFFFCWRIACLTYLSDDSHRAKTMTQAQAITHGTGWRSDGPPSCLGGSLGPSQHTHSAPILTTVVGGSTQPRALHGHVMSPRQNCLIMVAERVSAHGENVQPAREIVSVPVMQVTRRAKTRPPVKHTAKPLGIFTRPSVQKC